MSYGIIHWTPGVTLDAIEKQVILKAFKFYKGNKVATSSSLNIAVRTLDMKLERYDQEEKDLHRILEESRLREQEFDRRARGFAPSTSIANREYAESIKEDAPGKIAPNLKIKENNENNRIKTDSGKVK